MSSWWCILYEVLEKRIDLIGTEPPALAFENTDNADSPLTLDDLMGSIVMIDFRGTGNMDPAMHRGIQKAAADIRQLP